MAHTYRPGDYIVICWQSGWGTFHAVYEDWIFPVLEVMDHTVTIQLDVNVKSQRVIVDAARVKPTSPP